MGTPDNVIQLHADPPLVGEVADLVARYGYEEVMAELALHAPWFVFEGDADGTQATDG